MPSTRFSGLALLLAGSALMSACASVPDLGPAPVLRPVADRSAQPNLAAWPVSDWWGDYRDPQLDELMGEALEGAPTIATAVARVRIAQGYAQQVGAALAPHIDATASAGLVQQSETMGVPAAFVPQGWQKTGKLGLGFSIDPDLWGAQHAERSAARADLDNARYALAEARLVLTANIAATYAELARLHAQRDVLESEVGIRVETLDLVRRRFAAGIEGETQLRQAESRVPAARADLAACDEAIGLTRDALAALTGAGPDRAAAIRRPSVSLLAPRELPDHATIDLLGRRPDIAMARAGAEAAAERIKVARAAFYPNISLSGLIGLQSLGFSKLLTGGSTFGNVGPAVTLPIFHGGALAGQYRGARGQYDLAIAHYDETLVEALRQVADAVVSRDALAVRLDQSRAALTAATRAAELARHRYAGGLSPYLDVLTADESLLQARRNVADLEARAFVIDVSIIRALGGGFTASA
jgi:NodT family efflux transporter outer membrane factor (OMF) lipoprotein